jgi:DNA-binding transcriptional LysR family regulator
VDSRLIALHLGAHRVGAFASPEYLAKRGTPLHPDDLDGHDTVNFRYVSNGQVAQWSFQLGDRLVEVDVQSGITADSGDAVAQATAGGGGIGICPTYVAAPYVKRGKLVPVLDAAAVDHLPISALWPESGRGNPNVKAFTSFLSELFSPPAPWDAIVAEASAKPARRDDTASEEPSSGPRISDRTA